MIDYDVFRPVSRASSSPSPLAGRLLLPSALRGGVGVGGLQRQRLWLTPDPSLSPQGGGEKEASLPESPVDPSTRLSCFNIASLALGLAFLYLPIVILVIYSFNASRLVTVWGGWSLRWYGEFFEDRAMLEAAWMSFRVAATSATLATRLGTLAAVALSRGERFGPYAVFRYALCAAGDA